MKQFKVKNLKTHFKNNEFGIEIKEKDFTKLEDKKASFFQKLPREFEEMYIRLVKANSLANTYHSKRLFEYGFQVSVKVRKIVDYNLKIQDLSLLEKKLVDALKNDFKLNDKTIEILIELCEERQSKLEQEFENKLAKDKKDSYKALLEEYKSALPVKMHDELEQLIKKETALNDLYNKQQYINGFKVGF